MAKLKAYSKVNLILKVHPKKTGENKHRIESLMVLHKPLYDEITIKPSSKLSVTYYVDNKIYRIKKCNITKAILYMRDKHGCPVKWSVVVNKNIPLQSGLGGSSTDAACVMNYLHSINKHSPLDYQDIAMNLGSDIPFFLSKYDKALVKGYGNVVSQYKKATPNYKVIITNAPSNTKQIYSALTKDKCFHSQIQFMKLTGSLANLTSKQIYNDLEKYVIQVHPQLQKTLTKTKQGGICFFSGSGGSIIQLQNGKNIS